MMETAELLDGLNDKQREAVAAPLGNYLVLAGAGSGKTRVLTHRIAWLIGVENIPDSAIMAVTFTNKAAKEMQQRIMATLQQDKPFNFRGSMWIGTFHSIANRLLRSHYLDVNLPADFQIIDSEDQQRLMKRLLKLHNIDAEAFPHKQACWYINGMKDQGLRAHQIDDKNDKLEREWIRIYKIYQDACDRAGLVDFAELLLRSYELWLKNPSLLQRYQQRFQQILVDEFQDTNNIQYAWIKLLAGEHGQVMIVGDDDQSIYGWRGAKIENIQRFINDYQHSQTIRLEQNYRSTENILNAANELISNNEGRMGKKLWTTADKGEPIGIYSAFNEIDEARFVVSQIRSWQEKGGSYNDCAVLYRSNSQSRVIEDALLQSRIPYRIYGGFRFFERQEIKDALAYLRLISNRNDDAAFERVVNTPARGIGDRSLQALRQLTREREVTLWQAINLAVNEHLLPGRTLTALLRFTQIVNSMQEETELMSLGEQADYVIKHSGIYDMYKKEKGEKGEARIENLEELVNATSSFEVREDEGLTPLTSFLTHASLEAGEGQADPYEESVEMMTLHSAKGLEFPRVFMVGVEEGLFPSKLSLVEPGRLEEERRLAYVGITRAQQQLTISYAELRRQYGKEERHIVSRFLDELPNQCIQIIRLRGNVTLNMAKKSPNTLLYNGEWKPGQKVQHTKFGVGTIINVEGSEKNTRVQIAFQSQGIKWLIAALANLEKL